mgnify:CR=1 FL=1
MFYWVGGPASLSLLLRGPSINYVCPKWSKMVQNGPKWFKMVQNGPKWSKMVQNGPKWSKIVQNGPKWSKMVQNSPKWSKMVQNGLKWSKIVNGLQKKYQMFAPEHYFLVDSSQGRDSAPIFFWRLVPKWKIVNQCGRVTSFNYDHANQLMIINQDYKSRS